RCERRALGHGGPGLRPRRPAGRRGRGAALPRPGPPGPPRRRRRRHRRRPPHNRAERGEARPPAGRL
ncbi:MAG: hypothetical protein AVDCRST_MAG76-857, partial [uncultured Acidimicrobiales bacterium]